MKSPTSVQKRRLCASGAEGPISGFSLSFKSANMVPLNLEISSKSTVILRKSPRGRSWKRHGTRLRVVIARSAQPLRKFSAFCFGHHTVCFFHLYSPSISRFSLKSQSRTWVPGPNKALRTIYAGPHRRMCDGLSRLRGTFLNCCLQQYYLQTSR